MNYISCQQPFFNRTIPGWRNSNLNISQQNSTFFKNSVSTYSKRNQQNHAFICRSKHGEGMGWGTDCVCQGLKQKCKTIDQADTSSIQ